MAAFQREAAIVARAKASSLDRIRGPLAQVGPLAALINRKYTRSGQLKALMLLLEHVRHLSLYV